MRIPNLLIFIGTYCLVSAADSPKRAPAGFTGVRGKKSVPETGYAEQAVYGDDVGVMEEAPGKQQDDDWSGRGYVDPSEKRAGFVAMRGKKELVDYGEFEKRAPSGFLGMRGKKENENYNPYNNYDYEKRVPSGFLGMRGKKDVESFIEELKRVPNSGFFGMRGKKQAGFFGMRGKKYPYEFRGKFVGVRGKKASETPLHLPAEFYKGIDMNQLMLLLTENDDGGDVEGGYGGPTYSIN